MNGHHKKICLKEVGLYSKSTNLLSSIANMIYEPRGSLKERKESSI